MNRKQVEHLENFDLLEEYWNKYHVSDLDDERGSPVDSPIELKMNKIFKVNDNSNGYRSNRRISTATVFPPAGQSLSSHHPALSIPAFLQQFGPLIFPVYRAALLRKRILFVGEAPMEQTCNFGMFF